MDTLLNEEEEMLRNLAREFLEGECPPSLVREMEKDPLGYPPGLWKQVADLGWVGLAIPEQYGGQGAGVSLLGLVLEEAGRHMLPLPLHSTLTVAATINSAAGEAQKQDLLPKVASGDLILTWALLEEDPRYLASGIHLEAKEDGDNYVLNGAKLFVDNFEASDQVLVVARTAPDDGNNGGITLLLVDSKASGVTNTPLVTTAKDRQSAVEFANVRVPKSAVIGEVNNGWSVVHDLLDVGTALLCSMMCGAARKDVEMAIEYAKNRTAFGRPIGAFQSVAHMCADQTMWVDGAELLTREALWKLDQGIPASVEVSQAKSFSNEYLQAAVRHSQSIHGGMGFMMEFNLHLWYRRVAAWALRMGTTYEHRARISTALLDQPGRVMLNEPVVLPR
ncbi:MAG: acyl-CoA dehydrogenase family protein [Chloroflexota bacterium]|nr:acyl-CoA dehydrogenase family protein [Chloroflexota bacterium]